MFARKYTPEEIDAWCSVRSKGKTRFVFIEGILKFVVPMMFITSIISFLFDQGFVVPTLDQLLDKLTIIRVLIITGYGIYVGYRKWRELEHASRTRSYADSLTVERRG